MNLSKWARAAVRASGSGSLQVRDVEKLLQIYHDLLFKHNATAGEILTITGMPSGTSVASNYWVLLPFSRGSVHLKSADRRNDPDVDPRLFLAEFDVSALTAVGRFVGRFWFTDPVKTQASITGPPIPYGSTTLPNNATDAKWDVHFRETGKKLSVSGHQRIHLS